MNFLQKQQKKEVFFKESLERIEKFVTFAVLF